MAARRGAGSQVVAAASKREAWPDSWLVKSVRVRLLVALGLLPGGALLLAPGVPGGFVDERPARDVGVGQHAAAVKAERRLGALEVPRPDDGLPRDVAFTVVGGDELVLG